ncbi:MAG: phosphatase PAP2 family protein [Methylosarcina sp.]
MIQTLYRRFCTACNRWLPDWAWWLLGSLLLLSLLERLSVPPNAWDRYLLGIAQRMKGLWLDRFFTVITWSGSLLVLAPLTMVIAAILVKQGRTGESRLLVLSLAGAALFCRLTKLWFERPRPDLFPSIGELPMDASYPSAHTAQIVAFILALNWAVKPHNHSFRYEMLKFLAIMLATLVAFSRIYLQVHYPSDVLGGVLLATIWCKGLHRIFQTSGLIAR